MSFRAVLLGVVGALLIAAFGYVNDSILRLTFLVGNHFPISVFGGLIVFLLIVNPILFKLGAKFRASELAVVVAFMLASCSIPGSSLMRTFTLGIAMPLQANQQIVGWRTYDVLGYVPPKLIPGMPGATKVEYNSEVLENLLKEKHGGSLFDWHRVPWRLWEGPLETWLPIIFLTSAAVICLSLMIHSQWARRERLRYPITAFADALLEQDPDRGLSGVFKNNLFWLGLIVIFLIRVINGVYAWNDNSGIQIPLTFDFTNPIMQKWPGFGKGVTEFSAMLLKISIYPTAVAFAFFLSSDVALSLGFSQIAYVFLGMLLVSAGFRIENDAYSGGALPWQLFGSYLGIAILIAYVGRRYYSMLFKQAFTFIRHEEVDPAAAWATRFFVLCLVALTVMLSMLGLAWPFAALTVLLLMVMFLVMSRINAESGLFFIQPSWLPMAVAMGIFGARSMGPQAMAIMALVSAVLAVDPRETTMPFIINGLKISDDNGVKYSRVGWASIAIFGVALAVATPIVLTVQHNSSEPYKDKWARRDVPKEGLNAVVREMTHLSLAGQLDESKGMSTAQRIAATSPDPRFLWAAGVGLALALGFSFLRLRLPWWPLHPIMFLVWGTWTMGMFSHSFFLGWLLKSLVTRLGGGRGKHRQVLTLMIGVIAGDLLGGLVFMGFGALYHIWTGLPAKEYYIFPG